MDSATKYNREQAGKRFFEARDNEAMARLRLAQARKNNDQIHFITDLAMDHIDAVRELSAASSHYAAEIAGPLMHYGRQFRATDGDGHLYEIRSFYLGPNYEGWFVAEQLTESGERRHPNKAILKDRADFVKMNTTGSLRDTWDWLT